MNKISVFDICQRGGSWICKNSFCRITFRLNNGSHIRSKGISFRVVRRIYEKIQNN